MEKEKEKKFINLSSVELEENVCRMMVITSDWAYAERLVLGFTYHLDKETMVKTGSIYFIRCMDKSEENKHGHKKPVPEKSSLEVIGRHTCKFGILNASLEKQSQKNKFLMELDLSLSCSDGFLRILKISVSCDEDAEKFDFKIMKEDKINLDIAEKPDPKQEVICLYHDIASEPKEALGGMNKGQLILCDLEAKKVKHSIKAHDFEIWATRYHPEQPDVFFSGSDDTFLKGWDKRVSLKNPLFVNKDHTAGVCCITSCNSIGDTHTLATGSYDGVMRVFDTRKLSAAHSSIMEPKVGSQLWDIQFQKWGKDIYGIFALMYDGFKVGKLDAALNFDWSLPYKEHGSLGYGMAFWEQEVSETHSFMKSCTCSFYDNLIKYWALEI